VEHASADAEVSTWDSLPALGETARLEASDQEGSYSSGSTSGLADQLAATDPTVDATATQLTPPTKPDPNALEKELSAMVDANGQSPISGKLEDPKGTTESEVAADKMPALDAKALMAAGKIAAKAAADKLAVANVKFRGIPSLKYGANGVQKEGVTKESCESGCKNDEKCVSYSYSAKTSSCIVSTSLVMYDLEYTFYAKKKQKVEGVAAFRLLGAMKYFSPKGDKSVRAFPGIQLAGCQSNCAKNSDCNSFAYRKGDSTCLTSTQDIKYDPDWSYHEKVGAAELLAIKAKDESGAEPGASAAGKPKGEATPAKDDKAEDKKLEQADESSLSSSQLAILNAKKNTGSTAQAKAILLDGIAAKKALLNTEEQARIQVGKKLKAEADAKAEVENSLEKQGKATFKSDLSATKTKLDKAVAAAEKEGWSNSEKAAKSSEKSRENTQKANQEAAATKLRTKTEDGIALTAQKELEARDAVANIEQRKGLFKEQETHYKGLDNAKVAEIKQNKDAMATAAQTLIESKDTKTLDKYKAEAKAEQQKADDATRAINDKNLQITQIDTKIATLNTDKAAKATDLGNAEGKVKGTEEEIAAETDDALKMPLQKRLVEEQKSEKTMKDQAKVIDDRLAELAEKVTAGNTFIRDTDTKKSQVLAAAKAARLAATTEETRLDGLASRGKVAMDDARFRKNQALAAEFKIKSKLADETKAQLKFQESDTKAKLKAKDVKDKLTELEDSKKAQDVEEKIKTSIKFKEIATKKQKKVDDVVKEAKQDELRSVKMLSDGKYAQATAITAEQKVAAAEAVSNANALKATSEQKITALGPAKQAAKEAAAAAADKLDALKALFGSDEAGFKKAMATVKESDKKLAKEKVNGEVTEAEKLATEKKKLATEAAKLQGANLNKPGAPAGSNVVSAEDKANEIKQKMDKARQNVKDPTAEFLKEKQAKENLATKLKKDQALEKATKTQIAQAEERAELTQKTEVKQQADEKTGKTKAKAEAKLSAGNDAIKAAKLLEQTKKDEAVAATMDEANAKTTAQQASINEKKEKARAAAGSSSGVSGCDVGKDGRTNTLEAKEVCTKNKAKELEASETSAKTLAKNQEVAVKTAEKKTKSTEKAAKEGTEKKNAKEESATKEKATKESEQKSSTDESTQKENKKKENKTKDTAREVKEKEDAKKESGAKADAKMSQEERTKADASRESSTKNKEKASKSDEAGTKEKTAKEEKTAKQEKSTRDQMDESAKKKQASMTEETKNKASAEKDEKAIKQKELQATQSEKGTKEKTVKGSAEAATKQTAADSQREQTEKEVAQKKTAADSSAAASSEKQTKDTANEQNIKETKQKGDAAVQSQKENANKANANEQAGKVPVARL